MISRFSSICNATPTLFSPFSQPIPLLPFHCRFRFIAADLQSEAVAAGCSVSFAHPKLFSRCLAAESTTYYSSPLFFSLPWIFSRRRGNCVATRVTLYLRRSSISVIGTNLCYCAIPCVHYCTYQVQFLSLRDILCSYVLNIFLVAVMVVSWESCS